MFEKVSKTNDDVSVMELTMLFVAVVILCIGSSRRHFTSEALEVVSHPHSSPNVMASPRAFSMSVSTTQGLVPVPL